MEVKTSSHTETQKRARQPEAPHSPASPWGPSQRRLVREPPRSPGSPLAPDPSALLPVPPPLSRQPPSWPAQTAHQYSESQECHSEPQQPQESQLPPPEPQ